MATIVADGSEFRYAAAGEGAPVLVLHGGGGLQLTRTHELLASQARVIALEIPGFGDSPREERAGSLLELARAVGAFANALGLARFSLLGVSFGAALAAWVATEYPERIDKLVLIGSAAIRPEGPGPAAGVAPQDMGSLVFAHPEKHAMPALGAQAAKNSAAMLALLGPSRDAALEKRLSELEAPTLAVFGTEDRLTPPELGREYVELMPEAYLAFVYDAGHAVEIERPEATAEIVGDFLRRASAFVVSETSTLLLP